MDALPPPPPFPMGQTVVPGHEPLMVAPAMFGCLLQFGLFCILCIQTLVFYAKQGYGLNDNQWFRLYIGFVFILTGLQTATSLWRMYLSNVELQPWWIVPKPWIEPVLNCVIVSFVHAFFIQRCYKLSNSKIILSALCVALLAQLITSIILLVSTTSPDPERIRRSLLAVPCTTLVLDTLTSSTLFFNLWRQRTGRGDVDAVVLRVVRITIESIVPCVLCALCILIGTVYMGQPAGALLSLALPCLSPLYVNALLTTLNSRTRLRRQLDGERHGGPISLQNNSQLRISTTTGRVSTSNIQFSDPGPVRTQAAQDASDPSDIISPTSASMLDSKRRPPSWDADSGMELAVTNSKASRTRSTHSHDSG